MGTRKGQTIKEEKRNYKSRFWHVNCTLPPLPIHDELFINIPLLQVSLHSLCPRQSWSTSTSLHIIVPSYDASMHQCLWGSPVDMPKPSQPMLNKHFFNWRYSWPIAYVIVSQRFNFVRPHIQHNIHISATLSCWICHLLVDQHSAAYNIAGLIAVL